MRIYISGPITGKPDYNKHRFNEVEDWLRSIGHDPVNPQTLTTGYSETWEYYMRIDLKAMLDCDAIIMLEGWQESRGAKLEHDLAKELKFEIHYHISSTIP